MECIKAPELPATNLNLLAYNLNFSSHTSNSKYMDSFIFGIGIVFFFTTIGVALPLYNPLILLVMFIKLLSYIEL